MKITVTKEEVQYMTKEDALEIVEVATAWAYTEHEELGDSAPEYITIDTEFYRVLPYPSADEWQKRHFVTDCLTTMIRMNHEYDYKGYPKMSGGEAYQLAKYLIDTGLVSYMEVYQDMLEQFKVYSMANPHGCNGETLVLVPTNLEDALVR